MTPKKAYRTVSQEAEVEVVIQRSRFLGQCHPVDSQEDALRILTQTKKRYWDAGHHCYAYSIGAEGTIARFSDDGEPGGTAGMPMMEVLRNKDVTNVLCIVTRYFGGILLGAGGLVRAYSRTASEAVEAAKPVLMKPCAVYVVPMDYGRWGAMEELLRQFGQIQDIRFADNVTADVLVSLDEEQAFLKAVTNKSGGRIYPKREEERFGIF